MIAFMHKINKTQRQTESLIKEQNTIILIATRQEVETDTGGLTIFLSFDVELNIKECLDSRRLVVNVGAADIGFHLSLKQTSNGPLSDEDKVW